MPENDPPMLDYATPEKRKRRWWIPGLVAALLLIVGIVNIFTPRLYSTRETSPRVKCASNLRTIGEAILLYSNDHQGQYPDSVETMLLNEDITSEVFICPLSNDTAAIGATTQATMANLSAGGHLSYIYVGRGFNVATVPADAVVAYEPFTNHGGDGTNVLFGDGHVEFIIAKDAAVFVAKLGAGISLVIMPGH